MEDRTRGGDGEGGALAGVPVGLPALTRALKLQTKKAFGVGFDWNDPTAVLAKIREEADEIEARLYALASSGRSRPRLAIFLFAVVNLARTSMPIRSASLVRHQSEI